MLTTEQKIVNQQMTKMGFTSHNIEDSEDESNSENNNNTSRDNFNSINDYQILNEEEKKRKLLHNKIIKDRKMMLTTGRSLTLAASTDLLTFRTCLGSASIIPRTFCKSGRRLMFTSKMLIPKRTEFRCPSNKRNVTRGLTVPKNTPKAKLSKAKSSSLRNSARSWKLSRALTG